MIAQSRYWRHIWWQAVFGDGSNAVVVGTWVLGVLAVFGALIGGVLDPDRLRGACNGGGLMLAMLGGFYWLRFATGAATQNSPANARLVPRLTGHIRCSAVMAWIATMLFMLPYCYAADAGALAFVLLCFGVTGIGLYRAGREDGLVVAVAAMLLHVSALNWPPMQLALSRPAVLAAGLTAAIAYGWFGVRAAFPRGGERHWLQLDRQRKAVALDNMTGWDEVMSKDGRRNRIYCFLLRHYARTAAGRRKMLLLGLGPGLHPYYYGWVLLMAIVLAVLVKPVLVWLSLPVDNLAGMLGASLIGGLIGIMCSAAMRFSISIRATPGEQAVLMLVPGMPRRAQLTRALGRRIAAICFAEWCAAAIAVFAILALWDAGPGAYQVGAILMAVLLLCIGFSLEKYAQKSEVSIAGIILITLWVTALSIASLIVQDRPLAWLIVFAMVLGTALAFVRVRWQAMMLGPVVFPASRLP